jgi:hypothetical protein
MDRSGGNEPRSAEVVEMKTYQRGAEKNPTADLHGCTRTRTIAKSAGIAKIETNTFETQRKRRKNLCVADLRGYA